MDPEKCAGQACSDSEVQKPLESHVEHLRREQTRLDLDPAINRRLNRKFDLHVIPFLFGIWYDSIPLFSRIFPPCTCAVARN